MFSARRFRALAVKEVQQLKKNKRLMVQLVVPPTLALILFGLALNPTVTGLRMGVADMSRTAESRQLVDALTGSQAFRVAAWYGSAREAEEALRRLDLDLAVVIPPDYAELLARRRPAQVQVWIDSVNANTATIVQGYLAQSAAALSGRLSVEVRPRIISSTAILYNPGSTHSWFFVTGVMSALLFLNSALVASALAVREKELGTIEQLLMSPAQTMEVLVAKTVPVWAVALLVLVVALEVSGLVFGLPQRGAWWLLLLSASLAALCGIGIGITVATFSQTQQQAQLLTFFLMPPLVLLSGVFTPAESMPAVFQYISMADPIRYLAMLLRGVVLKGAGIDVLWPQLAVLATFSVALYGLSAWRFRGQLR